MVAFWNLHRDSQKPHPSETFANLVSVVWNLSKLSEILFGSFAKMAWKFRTFFLHEGRQKTSSKLARICRVLRHYLLKRDVTDS